MRGAHLDPQAGQAASEYLMTVALAVSLVTIVVTMLWRPLIQLVVVVVNHAAVFLTSVN